jgi:hypothetical protein
MQIGIVKELLLIIMKNGVKNVISDGLFHKEAPGWTQTKNYFPIKYQTNSNLKYIKIDIGKLCA